jgi:hypothetical protein
VVFARGAEGFLCFAALCLCACGVGLCLVWLPARRFCLCAYGVGLSLISYWFISVAPVRGGTYFSLPAAKRSKQEKAARSPC